MTTGYCWYQAPVAVAKGREAKMAESKTFHGSRIQKNVEAS